MKSSYESKLVILINTNNKHKLFLMIIERMHPDVLVFLRILLMKKSFRKYYSHLSKKKKKNIFSFMKFIQYLLRSKELCVKLI
jgi:hypothetical protein